MSLFVKVHKRSKRVHRNILITQHIDWNKYKEHVVCKSIFLPFNNEFIENLSANFLLARKCMVDY